MLRPQVNLARVSQTDRIVSQSHRADAADNNNRRFSQAEFTRQLAQQPQSIGAITPSSRSLARQVVVTANLSQAQTVVELGPGTGSFTEVILNNLRSDAKFFALELNSTFVDATRKRCPGACVYHDAASSLPARLRENKLSHADCVISSLPWTIFDAAEQDHILQAITDSLKPGGVFVSIVYLGAKFRSRGRYFIEHLDNHFSTVRHTPTVWQNLPPAQIYRCVK